MENSATKQLGNLGFGPEELLTALQSVDPQLDLSTITISDKFLSVKFPNARIAGRRRINTQKIFDIVVCGKGKDFITGVSTIIKLVSPVQEADRQRILMQFTTGWQDKKVMDEYLEFQGVRYRLQKLLGVPTFHCINARSEDREIVRAQPG